MHEYGVKTRLRLATLVRFLLVAGILFGVEMPPRSEQVAAWMRDGQRAIDQSDYPHAVTEYGHILRVLGPQRPIFQRLAQISLDAGRYADAQMYLYRTVDLGGWNAAAPRWMRLSLDHNGETSAGYSAHLCRPG